MFVQCFVLYIITNISVCQKSYPNGSKRLSLEEICFINLVSLTF